MIGADGTVVTELRGLSAWLAVHSVAARRHLIDIDPVGVCLYGDISNFTLDEKLELLESLKKRTYSLNILPARRCSKESHDRRHDPRHRGDFA